MVDKPDDDKVIDIKDYVITMNNYISKIKTRPINRSSNVHVMTYVGRELQSLDDKVSDETQVLDNIKSVQWEIERVLKIETSSPSKKGLINFQYTLAKHVPFMRNDNVSLGELLLLQSANVTKACNSLQSHSSRYDDLADSLQRYEEELYGSSELLASSKDDLKQRIIEAESVYNEHLIRRKENPTEREKNEWILFRNRLMRGLTDFNIEYQLAGQKHALELEQAIKLNRMIDYMKSQSGICKTIEILGRASADFLRETAQIHDVAERMQISSADVINKVTLAGRAVDKLGELRHMRQSITIDKTRNYIGSGEGNGYSRMLDSPIREAKELTDMIQRQNEQKVNTLYELEYNE
jgi:hypothetical protein